MLRIKYLATLLVLGVALVLLFRTRDIRAESHQRAQGGFITALYAAIPQASYAKFADSLPTFLKFCGYNTLELVDGSYSQPESGLEAYYKEAKANVAKAHKHGLKVYIILLTNESRRLNIKKASKNEYKVLFNPVTDPAEYQERLKDVQLSIQEAFPAADGFEVFAGDPGGCVGKGCNLDQFLLFGHAYTKIVKDFDPGAEVTLNTWAIGNWGGSLGVGIDFWDADMELARRLVERKVPFGDAITLDGPNFYRFLVRQLYTEAGRPVPNWPTRTTIDAIHAQSKRAYLWPHFVVDDDPGRPLTFNKVHFEVRYLRDLAQKVRDLGFDGVFVNAYNPQIQMGNIYAYGQLGRNPDKQAREILKDFAALIAQLGSVDQLTEVFTFMENHSWWGSQMPAGYQLKPLPCKIATYDQALAALKGISPLAKSSAPLLTSPKDYLAMVHSTLVFMKEHYRD